MKRMILDDEVSKKLIDKLIEMTDERSIHWENDAVVFKNDDCLFTVNMSEEADVFEILEVKVNDHRNIDKDYDVHIVTMIPFNEDLMDLIEEKETEDLKNEIHNGNLWSNNVIINYGCEGLSDEVSLEWDNFTVTKTDDDYVVTSNISYFETNLKNVLSREEYHLFCYRVESFLNNSIEDIMIGCINNLIEN